MASRLILILLFAVLVTSGPSAEANPRTRARSVTRPATEAASETVNEENRKEIDKVFSRPATAQAGTIPNELLQIVGQVVADRATQAGWSILERKIKSSLDCEDKTSLYASTCKVFENVRIPDLLSSPGVLLEAAVTDFARIWRGKLLSAMNPPPAFKNAVELAVGTAGVLALWGGTQKDGAFAVVLEQARERIRDAAGQACPSESANLPLDLPSMRAAYGVALCLVNETQPTYKGRLENCDLATRLATCGANDPATMAAASGLKTSLTRKPIDAVEGVVLFLTHGAAGRLRLTNANDIPQCFAKGETDPKKNLCATLVEDVGEATIGLARQDWTRFASGAVAVLNDHGKLGGEKVSGTRFFQLLAGIGQYALTYKDPDGTTNENAAKARRDIIESLVKQMTHRDDRTGWIVSVGGSLGAGYMHRKEFSGDTEGSSVLALPLGLGIQYYPESVGLGFHAQAGVFDLGQYVTFEDDHTTTVGTPDVKAAIALSLSVGVWTPWLSRSIPIFIGPYGGIAPFVLANGKPEYFIGGMVGAYVPLLDF
jgi:hypothetical protein